jgi:hypothetical protein
VTPTEMLNNARAYSTANGYVLEEVATSYNGTGQDITEDLGLPWDDAWLNTGGTP